jgi:hypothetical protein
VLKRAWKREEVWKAARVVRPAAFLSTARGKHEELLSYLDKEAPAEVRRVGYECLWPNGRMRVFDKLQQALKEGDPPLRRAVVMGFAYVGSLGGAEESTKVCGLLGPLLGDKDPQLASMAAQRLVTLCPKQRGKVLGQAGRRLGRRELQPGFVSALESLHKATNPPAAEALRRRSLALLARILNSRRLSSGVRAMALYSLHRLDPDRAKKLAARHKEDKEAAVSRAAEMVLRQQ